MDTAELLDGLNSVITIPIIPFRGGRIDYDAHRKNTEYLLSNNSLDNNRKRVIAPAGTSLINHIDLEEQNRLLEFTSEIMGDDGILISAIVPNPIGEAGRQIEAHSKMKRPPDAYLVMPLGGVYSSEGLYEGFMEFADTYGNACAARFLYYYRAPHDREAIIRLVNDSPHFVGVKVGTTEEDVPPMLDGIGDSGMVIWGVGDRSTKAAELGAKGHTSGISVFCAGAGDEINNAQRKGDFETSREIEKAIAPLEEIRFENNRIHNYSAVIEAMRQSGFDDIDGGDGGPFNPSPPAEICNRVKDAMQGMLRYH